MVVIPLFGRRLARFIPSGLVSRFGKFNLAPFVAEVKHYFAAFITILQHVDIKGKFSSLASAVLFLIMDATDALANA